MNTADGCPEIFPFSVELLSGYSVHGGQLSTVQ